MKCKVELFKATGKVLTGLGSGFNIWSTRDIVIFDRKDLAEYITGRIFPQLEMEPVTDFKIIREGPIFVYEDRLWVCDPRSNPSEGFEVILKDSEKIDQYLKREKY